MKIYQKVLAAFGESKETIKELVEIKETGILCEQIHHYIRQHGFEVEKETYWLINPIYTKNSISNP